MQVTQMDPKEYLPFLNALHDMPEELKRFRIDVHLKNMASALSNLQLVLLLRV